MNESPELFIRDRNSLDDFLYEINSIYMRKESAEQFDLIDAVLISGEANLRPWSPSAEKVGRIVYVKVYYGLKFQTILRLFCNSFMNLYGAEITFL